MIRKRVVARDAKIQKFISKHLHRKTRNNDNLDQLCDVQIIYYEITDYQNKHAVLQLEKGLHIEASFVEFDQSVKRRAMRCYNATRQVSHQCILAPIFLTYNEEKQRILLFYERYDYLFDAWNGGHDIWWQQALHEQLQATKYLIDKGFIHTGLDNPRNFVIKDNKLKMLNITSTIQDHLNTHPGTNADAIKRDSFRSLRNLMWPRYVERKDLTEDDQRFFNLFNLDNINFDIYVQKLITHPYAKDFKQCMNEFQDIHMLDGQKRLMRPLRVVTRHADFGPYRGWMRTIRNSRATHLKKALPKGAGEGERSTFREEDIDTLIKFLRNINEHRGKTRDQVDKYFQAVYKEVKRLFPGLLSVVHEKIRIRRGT
ncbi:hypothetical protein ACLB2K_043650 [Fragaria x ananassa]